MSNILAFDTVSSSFSIALKKDNNIIEVNKENIKNHNEELLPILNSFLEENKISLNEINCIVMGIGPGSFTAIRIAFSTIKTICYAKNIPIIGASSLETLYQNIVSYNGIKLSMIDARKGSIYANIYKDNNKIKENLDLTYEEAVNLIKDISTKDDTITLCGDGFSKNEDYFLEKLQEYKLNKLDNSYNIIKASNSILMSKERYNKRQFDNIFSLNPLYIRKSEAENKLNIKN
ncbi:tRNA (adenosine(37)-N6)-threonylcarbamoyltransferase complex dimerization subunit type 1 TsaB [Brachyspira pilosicoli]|uniref:tRNA (adenosine(37)-N6)-threonylcarbamoyltransferase complex dimerization subunit type 1 TsaB n=1 Tax=Brachyspira pilosicoli TaxID=52584 RepID=UPI001CA50894|nr:tRNA (adenosine(37)-N6)-threonylcarbamoyltransferase complex dimerization subunit type 1 TsaB [Brachyspira pilosicoli]MBW5379011.1 tRNA (adenosine(37)-N6)-threonylcarbamoyltransferase complex dimerization subunit type 1 TsaB [Brachyspira pilosicoli]WIH86162.1 tRNA (adenosine(37)-N6)-threonylcarbamoyltransferase complex dimerization subunit type 1 TsaB [Brachyspira pilosicoli]